MYFCKQTYSIDTMSGSKKTVHVIINPASGTSSKKDLPQKFAAELDSAHFDVRCFTTKYAGQGDELARQAIDEQVDYVIAVGGDGTVNEVARALIGSNTALGIIPCGSGNGLARDLFIPVSVDKALKIIKEEHVIDIDYGIADGHIFFCTCGMGFDALVSERVAGFKKRGSLMYLKSMLEVFVEQHPETYEIIYAGEKLKVKAFVVNCANTSQYGYNAYIAPHASTQDGLMNISILKPLTILDAPITTIQLFAKNLYANKKLIHVLTKDVTIIREKEGIIHIDGDPIPAGKEINVQIVHRGLKVLAPTTSVKQLSDPFDVLSSILTRWV
ncbi:MAG: diacylglycerol kinase family lipid kinase [Prevotella sp.]|nr:diacylglycerol kinase family lipid kinase [Prevotella sp.]